MVQPDTNGTDEPFDDCELNPEAILGERQYSGRIYSPEKAEDVINVDVCSGEHTHEIPPVQAIETWIMEKNEESRQKAEEKSWHDHTDHVALVAANGEHLYESGSLVSRTAFFHMDVTSHKLHFAYSVATKSDEYDVSYDVDYDEGAITITVREVGD